MATGSAAARCISRGWLVECGQADLACWRYRRWLVVVPGCAAEGMAAPLAIKDLRPLRGAFGVLDREPPARPRQKEGQAASLPQRDAAQPSTAPRVW
jgi:hypothetical protein